MVYYELEESRNDGGVYGSFFDGPMSCSFNENNNYQWSQVVEATMPLKTSKLTLPSHTRSFQGSLEMRSRKISSKVVWVNLISLVLNLVLALIAFYFSFSNNSPSTTAFAADCVLDFISSAIVLWRYYGDLNSIYMQAREQIACIYLGALFELSALAIIIKAISDIVSDSGQGSTNYETSYELVYLASAATLVCIVLTFFKCSLYRTLRDKSILLDVVNTLISTVFALSIVMSQILINIEPTFWYLDPILSIVLAAFMMCFGAKVIYENFHVLRPIYYTSPPRPYSGASGARQLNSLTKAGYVRIGNDDHQQSVRPNSKKDQVVESAATATWQNVCYSSITFT